MTGAAATLAVESVTSSVGWGEQALFFLLAPVAVLAALGLVFLRSAVHSALMLAVVMLSLAVFYAALDAPFLAFVQIIVYTGAIMMLFLFVVMLVGVDASDSLVETLKGQRVATGLAALAFATLFIAAIGNAVTSMTTVGLGEANAAGNVDGIARLLFTRYVFAFEITSALLITAALGAMVLAHKERVVPRLTQRQMSQQRFRSGKDPSPLPGPGVYATHNAVDTPALLPDGSTAPNSISPTLVNAEVARSRRPEPLPQPFRDELESKR